MQIIRAASILQLLLGNVGRPGGGLMAERGHASIQGSTDVPTLYDLLPGYLHQPRAREGELTLADYVESGGSDRGWWANFDKYVVSLLKAWFGDAATEENDYGFGRLPKISGNHSHFPTMLRAVEGGLDGMLVMGQNPAVSAQHAGLSRGARSRASSGSWCATSPRSRAPPSGTSRPRSSRASCARRTSGRRSS